MADIQQPKTSTPALILKDFPVGFPCQSFCSGNTNETPPKSAATVQAAHDHSQHNGTHNVNQKKR